jgi:hypothetical protein
MTGPMPIVAVFCPKCGRGQITKVADAPDKPTPCWWCRHGIIVSPRAVDTPGKMSAKTLDQ